MPFINFKTNIKIEKKEELKSAFGQLISMIPKKSEPVTMVRLSDEEDLYYGGSDAPCALVETLVNKNSDHSVDTEYCKAVIEMISETLPIPKNRIYTIVDEQDCWVSMRD